MQNYKFKKLTTNIVQSLLNKGYKIDDFQLSVEKFEGKLHFASFSNSKSGLKDFGLGDTEKFSTSKSHSLGFREHSEREGCDIAENGHSIDHKAIYKSFVKEAKASALKEVNGVPSTAILFEHGSLHKIAPSVELAKSVWNTSKSNPNKQKIKVVNWSFNTKNHAGYKDRWDVFWKKQIKLQKNNSQELGKERTWK